MDKLELGREHALKAFDAENIENSSVELANPKGNPML